MPKPVRTRFYATIDGVDRVLLTVHQNSDGGLTVTSKTPSHFQDMVDGTTSLFVNQHYSVHETNSGNDTQITQKTQLSDAHHSLVTFLPNTREYLLWPVFFRRYPYLENKASMLVRKSKEIAVRLTTYSYNKSNLLFGVFVTRPNFDLKILTSWKIKFKHAVFDNHMVIVIPYFINLPSMPDGDVLTAPSSTPIKNGQRSEDHKQLKYASIPPNKFIDFNWGLMIQLRDIYSQRLANDLKEIKIEHPEIILELATLTQDPALPHSG